MLSTLLKVGLSCVLKDIMTSSLRGQGGGGALFEISLEIDFMSVSDREGSNTYLLLLVLWKNIVPSQSYRRSKVSAHV